MQKFRRKGRKILSAALALFMLLTMMAALQFASANPDLPEEQEAETVAEETAINETTPEEEEEEEEYIPINLFGVGASRNLSNGITPTSASAGDGYGAGTASRLPYITDGLFNTADANMYNFTGPGYIQIDLGGLYEIDYIHVWRYWVDSRRYNNTVVAVAETTAGFSSGAGRSILFNADVGNIYGLGAGSNTDYTETSTGRQHAGNGAFARYVRVYSNGNTVNAYGTHIIEIQAWGWDPAEEPGDPSVLMARYNALKDTANTGYTTATWNAFQSALTSAAAVLANAEATQQVINNALSALNTAFAALAPGGVKTALQNRYDEVKGQSDDNFTASTWSAFQSALTAAAALLTSTDIVAQSVYDTALSTLNTAFTGLTPASNINTLIPKPVSVTYATGKFALISSSRIIVDAGAESEGEYLASKLRPSTGFALPVVIGGTPTAADIVFKLIGNAAMHAAAPGIATSYFPDNAILEAYILESGPSGLTISAGNPQGLFRGLQSVRQLLPPDIEKSTVVAGAVWEIKALKIIDFPRYEFRSIMIDICRHYHSPERVKRQIDIMAQFKMNVMHLHMTEDQGFRIASEKYPELNIFGGALGMTSTIGSPNYGLDPRSWTKAEFLDVVEYAAERYIDVVPEIEFPSHDSAQLISLPLLNSNGLVPDNSISNFTSGSVGYSITLDPSVHKYTKQFMQDIIGEIAAMTKSKYIHIGGDEANSMSVAAYAAAVQPVIDAVKANGKLSIQWNQASSNSNDFPKVDVLQNWATTTSSAPNYASRQLALGANILASIAERAYIDHPTHRSTPFFGASWANSGGVSVHTAYMWDPEESVPAAYRDKGRVIGIDNPLWAENIGAQFAHDVCIYPRLLGYAELGWSPYEDRTTNRPSATSNTAANLTQARTNAAYLDYENRVRDGGYNFRLQNQGVVLWNHPQLWAAKSVNVPTKSSTVTTTVNTPLSGSITWSRGSNLTENDTVTLLLGASPVQGTVTFDQQGNWTYTPKTGFTGPDGFTILFNVDGYGVPLNTSPTPGSSVTTEYGYHQVNITVNGVSGTTYSINASLIATGSTVTRVALDPPVGGMTTTSFFTIPGVTTRRVLSLNGGSTYLIFHTRRNESVGDRLTIARSGYSFNTVQLPSSHNILPKPVTYVDYEGQFQLKSTSKIVAPNTPEGLGVGDYLAGRMRASTGFELPVVTSGATPDDIVLKLTDKSAALPVAFNYGLAAANYATVGDEGYRIYVNIDEGVVIAAYTEEGLFRGVQSLRQLLPAEIEKTSPVAGVNWVVPYCHVLDYPRYEFRSIMLDIARTWFPKEVVKRQIDLLAQYKINVVRMHMTEDQSWRLAMSGYPELTDFGGSTKILDQSSYNGTNVVGTQARLIPGSVNYGVTPGYLTKADFLEILAYADERFIKVIPEIEVPSHCYSLMMSLPLLNSTGVLTNGTGNMTAPLSGSNAMFTGAVGQCILANPTGTSVAAKYTKAVLEDVFSQIGSLMYGRHDTVHIGGDEANVGYTAATQNTVFDLCNRVLHSYGIKTMSWHPSDARTVDHTYTDIWTNWATSNYADYASRAVAAGSKIVCAFANYTYLDHFAYNTAANLMPIGHSWARSAGITPQVMFNFDPETSVPSAYQNTGAVIGVEGPLWSETYGTQEMLDLLIYPRVMCLAEVGWSPAETRSGTAAGTPWANFQPRAAAQGSRMTYQGITFENEPQIWPAKTVTISTANGNYTSPTNLAMNTPLSGKFNWNATTADGDAVRIKKASEPSQGTLTLDAAGNWTYTPNKDFVGRDAFTVAFQIDGFGVPLGAASTSNKGYGTYTGYRSVYLNITGSGEIAVTVTKAASRPTNLRIKLDPPVPGLLAANFSIPGVTIRMAESYDNGNSYLLITSPRDDGNAIYTLTVTKTGTAPVYTFNTLSIADKPISPKPVSYKLIQASFIIKPETKIFVNTDNAAVLAAANDLAATFRASTGYTIPVATAGEKGIRDISLQLIPTTVALTTGFDFARTGYSGYYLETGVDGAVLKAYVPSGLARGIKALYQLLPATIKSATVVNEEDWIMPFAEIADYQPVTSLKIDALPTVGVVRGGTYNFKSIINEGAVSEDITWSVNNPAYATVSSDGSVTILNKTGTVVLIATSHSGMSFSIVLRIT